MTKWNDEYMIKIYHQAGFNENEYPLNLIGLLMFLRIKGIDIVIQKSHNFYFWTGANIKNSTLTDMFSEDFTEYKTFDDAINSAIIESFCYLHALKN